MPRRLFDPIFLFLSEKTVKKMYDPGALQVIDYIVDQKLEHLLVCDN